MWFGIHGSFWAGANSSLNQGTAEKGEVERQLQDGAKGLGTDQIEGEEDKALERDGRFWGSSQIYQDPWRDWTEIV